MSIRASKPALEVVPIAEDALEPYKEVDGQLQIVPKRQRGKSGPKSVVKAQQLALVRATCTTPPPSALACMASACVALLDDANARSNLLPRHA